jgi:hypothetical protein
MSKGPDRRERPSAVDLCAAAAGAVMAGDAAAVQSHLEYVLDERVGSLGADQRRVLEAAWRNARRMAKLAEDLRDLALAEAGELPLALGTCDLPAMLAEAVERSRPVACVAKKAIEVNLDGDPRPEGDPLQLSRAVSALVEHAVEQATAGTPIVILASDAALAIEYETAGSPLDDPLGLALASAVAKLHGGGLDVELDDRRTALTLTFGGDAAARAA